MNNKKILIAGWVLTAYLSILMLTGARAQNAPVYVPSDGLVGWWPFNGNAGDSSGKGNHGTVYSASLTTDRFNNANAAYEFRPSFSSRIEIPFSSSVNQVQSGITISAWIYMDGGTGAGNQPRVLEMRGLGYGGNAGYYIITQNNSNFPRAFEMALYSDSGNKKIEIAPSSTVSTYTWHHIVFVADGKQGTASFYVDGKLLNSAVNQSLISSCNFGNQSLFIGSETTIQGKWGGKIDDVGVWSKPFSGCEVSALFSNQKPTPKSLNLGPDTLQYCHLDSVRLQAAGGFAQYRWSNGASGGVTYAKQTGRLSLIGTDSNGCSSFDTVFVSLLKPVIQTPQSTVCYGDSVYLQVRHAGMSGSNPMSWTWNGSDTGKVLRFEAQKDTLVWVMVTDGAGVCYDTALITVSKPMLDFKADTLRLTDCRRDSMMLNAGFGWSRVTWNTGIKDSVCWLKTTGLYVAQAENTYGCKASDSVYFENPGKPLAAIVRMDSAGCFGASNGRLVSRTAGGYLPYTKTWSNTQTGDTAVGLNTGSYSFTATDAYGCADTIEAKVEGPVRIMVSTVLLDSASCNGAADASLGVRIDGGTPGFAYTWAHDATVDSLVLKGIKAGQYTLSVKDAADCSDTFSVLVGEPAPLQLRLETLDSVRCFGASDGRIVISAIGGNRGYTYTWKHNPNLGGPEATGLNASAYSVAVKDYKGCTDSITIQMPEPPVLTLAIVRSDSVSCFSDSDGVLLSAVNGGTAPYTYAWNDPASTSQPEIRGLGKGTYALTVKDARGCLDSISAEVFERNAPVDLEIMADRVVNAGDTITCTANVPAGMFAYNWTPANVFGIQNAMASPRIAIDNDITVQLEINRNGRCVSIDTAFIRIKAPSDFYIPNTFTPNGDGKNEVFGVGSEFEIEKFEIYDGFGGLMFRGSPQNPSWDGRIQGKIVPVGMYMYIIRVKHIINGNVYEAEGMVQVRL